MSQGNKKYEFEYKVECPFFIAGKRCGNEMVYNGSYTTSLGTFNKVDPNSISETFTCKKCMKTFTRSFKWQDVHAAPIRIFHKNADISAWCPSVEDLEEFSKQLDDMEKDNG